MFTFFRSKSGPLSEPMTVRKMDSAARVADPKVLAVSFSYPPQTEPRAIQVSRLLKHLRASTVLVCAGDPNATNNAALSGDCEDAESFLEEVLRVPFSNSSWRNLLNRVSSRFPLPVWSRTPDPLVPWKKPVIDTIERFIRARKYQPDVLVTFAFPLIDNIIGLELKRRFRFPWLAHFSDPWVDSPFRTDDRLTRVLNARLEQRVIESADRLVFTSQETADLVMRKYQPALRAKVRIVPHAYETDLFPEGDGNHGGRLVVRYLGDFYLDRTPKPLFQALEGLSLTEPELLKDFSFELIGEFHELDLERMGLSRLPADLVVFQPRVSYRESLALMTSAAGLMVIDALVTGNDKSVFLPSKLIEYLGAGRPIIGLTPPGTAADLIRGLGGWVGDPGDVNQLTTVLREYLLYLSEHRGDSSRAWGQNDVRAQFEATAVAKKFQQVLMELS